MDLRQLVRLLALVRIGVGAVLLVLPGRAGARWIGAPARDPRVKLVVRGLGVRDLALGLGTYQALGSGAPVRPWATAGALSDAGDAVATVLSARRLGAVRSIGTVVSAAGSAAIGLLAAGTVDEGLPRR